MRVLTGIAFVVAVLVGSSLPVAGAAVSLPARDPAWWSPDASLRLVPLAPALGPPHALFDASSRAGRCRGPGSIDVRAGGPAHHYAAIRDNTTLVSSRLDAADIGADRHGLGARAAPTRETLRVGALVAGRSVVLGTIAPGLSWRRYAFPATPIRGTPIRWCSTR